MNPKPHLNVLTDDVKTTTAPPELRFDPLDVPSLPPTDGMELDYRTQILSPRDAQVQTIRDVLRIVFAAATATLLLQLATHAIGGWWIPVATSLLCAALAFWAQVAQLPRELRAEIAFAAGILAVLGLCLLAPWPFPSLPRLLPLLLSFGLLLLLACRVVGHYLHWLNANPNLSREMRRLIHHDLCSAPLRLDWNRAYLRRQTSRIAELGSMESFGDRLPTDAERKSVRLERRDFSFPLIMIVFILIAAPLRMLSQVDDASIIPPDMVPELWQAVLPTIGTCYCLLLILAVVVCLALMHFLLHVLGSFTTPPSKSGTRYSLAADLAPIVQFFSVIWRAFVSYYTYNRHGTEAPGVFRSPYGPWWQRRILVVLALATTTSSMLSLTGYGAVPLSMTTTDHWRPGYDLLLAAGRPLPWHPDAALAPDFRPASQLRAARILTYPEGYVGAAIRGVIDARPAYFAILLALLLISLFLPIALFLTTLTAVGARVLIFADTKLELPDCYQDPNIRAGTPWAAYTRRLQNSPHATVDIFGAPVRESDHILVGFNLLSDYPVLMHRDIPRGHTHLTGDTGSGKSTLGLANLCNQLIGPPNISMVILDLKGDMALFHGVRHEARRFLYRFKWLTNRAMRSTFAFNVFTQQYFTGITIHQKTEMLLKSLGLDYGEGYGPAFYAGMNRRVLHAVFAARPNICSFRELDHFLQEEFPSTYKALGISKKEFEEAAHLYTIVHSLASFDSLNVVPSDDLVTALAHAQRIDMSAVVREPHIVYFHLPASVEQKSVREIARLALHSLLAAASERGTSKHEVYLVIDEFAQVVDTALEVILQQARDMGISAILANQSLAQLRNMSTNLIPTILANTRGRQIFSASDPEQQDTILKVAGQTGYTLNGWLRAAQYYLSGGTMSELYANGGTGPASALFKPPSFPLERETEPRLNRNDLLELSNHPLRSVVQFTRQAGFTCYGGYPFPIQSQFHVTAEEYRARRDAPWPTAEAGTLVQAVPATDTRPTDDPGTVAPLAPSPPDKPTPTRLPLPGSGPGERRDRRGKSRPASTEQALLRGIDAL